MKQKITRRIFAHSFPNPPAEYTSSDINLSVTNSRKRISLVKEAAGAQSRYLLSVMDAATWLSSSGQSEVEKFVADLLLAANLSLRESVLSTRGLEINQTKIELNQPPIVHQTPDGVHIAFTESIRETVHITVGFAESIDEENWISILELVLKVDRRDLTAGSKLLLINLRKALNEYENAMSSVERQSIFKHLFNSLELATNWNKQLSGDTFDKEVAVIARVSADDAKDWRTFYNRTKHIDRTVNQLARFTKGVRGLPGMLTPLRLTSEAVLLDRLKKA